MASVHVRRRMWKCMCLLILGYFVGTIFVMHTLYRRTHTNPRENEDWQYVANKPLILVGILSEEKNYGLRNAHRKTWLSRKESHGPYRVKVYFLLDIRTLALQIEQSRLHDMFFFNSTKSSSDTQGGQKLHVWFKFAAKTYPEAELVILMDDEVFICTPQIFDRLKRISSKTLYYGYVHPHRCIDDTFIVLGMTLVKRISDKVYCGSQSGGMCAMYMEEHLSDMGSTVTTLCHWLKPYSDYVIIADNFYMRLGYSITGDTNEDPGNYKTNILNFCSNYLLYHESSVYDIFTFFKHNSRRRTMEWKGKAVSVALNNSHSGTTKSFSGKIIRNLPQIRTEYPNDQIVRYRKTKGKNCRMWAVFYPVHNFNITDVMDVAANPSWCLVVVADMPNISESTFSGASFLNVVRNEFVFLSSTKQNSLYPHFHKFAVAGHASRKNIGYIYALDHGANVIWDISEYHTRGNFVVEQTEKDQLTICPDYRQVIVNPLECYGILQKPRGFPLSFDISQAKSCQVRRTFALGVMQLFDPKRPDVEQIKSNESELELTFDAAKMIPLQIPKAISVPLNYHSTVWSAEAFPYLFLPSTVSSDAADIWRGYIAQMSNNFYFEVSYVPVSSPASKSSKVPSNNHERSEDLTKRTGMLIELLDELRREHHNLDMETFYEEMYKRGYIESHDLLLLHVWRKMLVTLGIL